MASIIYADRNQNTLVCYFELGLLFVALSWDACLCRGFLCFEGNIDWIRDLPASTKVLLISLVVADAVENQSLGHYNDSEK